MIPLGTFDSPDLDCDGIGENACLDDEVCLQVPEYDYWMEWQPCEDPDACKKCGEFVPPFCSEAEGDIPF